MAAVLTVDQQPVKNTFTLSHYHCYSHSKCLHMAAVLTVDQQPVKNTFTVTITVIIVLNVPFMWLQCC